MLPFHFVDTNNLYVGCFRAIGVLHCRARIALLVVPTQVAMTFNKSFEMKIDYTQSVSTDRQGVEEVTYSSVGSEPTSDAAQSFVPPKLYASCQQLAIHRYIVALQDYNRVQSGFFRSPVLLVVRLDLTWLEMSLALTFLMTRSAVVAKWRPMLDSRYNQSGFRREQTSY